MLAGQRHLQLTCFPTCITAAVATRRFPATFLSLSQIDKYNLCQAPVTVAHLRPVTVQKTNWSPSLTFIPFPFLAFNPFAASNLKMLYGS
jgi:hypothetical protein